MAPGGADQATGGSAALIRFEAVSKRFGAIAAVETLTLDIAQGEFFALLGPSGCGKTTLLRMLAGFETPSEGRIFLGGEDIVPVPPHRRPVNMMFQSYALFPHLTVEGNIAFGLRQENAGRDEIAARVAEMLDLTRLQGFGGRKIHQLSGGQRQRVALAQAPPRAAARRAARRARQEAACRNAVRADGAAAQARHDLCHRYPRPGGGDDRRRPHRGDESGPPDAGCDAH
jgi:ABC-type uncharacterized transport system YnjBCD ATPase subunit